jgi:hypothetical protein
MVGFLLQGKRPIMFRGHRARPKELSFEGMSVHVYKRRIPLFVFDDGQLIAPDTT